MATLTEMVAAVVVHSSAAAFAHFGVTVETPKADPPRSAAVAADQRVIARSPRQVRAGDKVMKANCADGARAQFSKA